MPGNTCGFWYCSSHADITINRVESYDFLQAYMHPATRHFFHSLSSSCAPQIRCCGCFSDVRIRCIPCIGIQTFPNRLHHDPTLRPNTCSCGALALSQEPPVSGTALAHSGAQRHRPRGRLPGRPVWPDCHQRPRSRPHYRRAGTCGAAAEAGRVLIVTVIE